SPMFERLRMRVAHPHIRLIAAIGVIVPRRLRAGWRQEGEAELRYRETQLAEWNKLDCPHKLDLLWHSLGAFADAFWLQQNRLEDEMFQDLWFGARLLLKNRMVTSVAVISLALGIGANTAMFSFVDAVLLKPFTYQDPKRLVMVWEKRPDSERTMPTGAAFLAWRAHQQVFSHLAAITSAGGDLNLTGGDRAERVSGTFVSANY